MGPCAFFIWPMDALKSPSTALFCSMMVSKALSSAREVLVIGEEFTNVVW